MYIYTHTLPVNLTQHTHTHTQNPHGTDNKKNLRILWGLERNWLFQ